jgi:uncharacterized protein YdbL (DUF1318 family)
MHEGMTMRANWLLSVAGAVSLGACVTINVYFPAAAAERAADRIIDEVWGEQGAPKPAPASKGGVSSALQRGALAILELLIPAASAQANIDIDSPAINSLKASMSARHRELAAYYASGAVGLTAQGLVALRDAKAVPLAERPTAAQLVAAENRDRNALYQAIAQANGHPEWEPDIRATFARRWIERAQPGWWHQSGGNWTQR